MSEAAVHIHLPLDARDFAGGMATCGDEVDEEQMGILGGPLPGYTGKHSRRVTCPECRTTTLEEAAARNAARPPPRYDRCPDRCQCLVHAAPGAVEHG